MKLLTIISSTKIQARNQLRTPGGGEFCDGPKFFELLDVQ